MGVKVQGWGVWVGHWLEGTAGLTVCPWLCWSAPWGLGLALGPGPHVSHFSWRPHSAVLGPVSLFPAEKMRAKVRCDGSGAGALTAMAWVSGARSACMAASAQVSGLPHAWQRKRRVPAAVSAHRPACRGGPCQRRLRASCSRSTLSAS